MSRARAIRRWVLPCALACVAACGSDMEPAGASGSGGSGAAGGSASGGGAGASGGTGGTAGRAGGSGSSGGSAGSAAGGGGSAGTGAGGGGGSGGGGAGQGDELDAGAAGDGAMPSAPMTLAERVCPEGASYDPPSAGTRSAQKVQDGFGFLEGPVWLDALGVLLFSDMDFGSSGEQGPSARIRRFTPPSGFDVFVEGSNSNGLALDLDGDVLACTHDIQSLSRFDAQTAMRTPLDLTVDGKHFNSPNDLTVRSDGTIYFSDPDWQLGPRTSETGVTGVYRVTPGGDVVLVTDALDKPNGVALSPDERTLYVGSAGNDVLAYPVAEDGSVGAFRVLTSPGGTDGMAIDCAGNVYLTSGMQVRVFSPAGDALYAIDVPETPSNAAFGGSDHKTLYITAQTGLYSIALEIPGLPY